MPRKPIEVIVTNQNVIDDSLVEDYKFDPKYPTRFYISNVIQRVFAHLHARSEVGTKKLVCTTAGELKVAIAGSGYEHNVTKSGNAPDAYGAANDYGRNCSTHDVFIFDNAAVIKMSQDGVLYDDEIEIPANSTYSFDVVKRYVLIKNKVALSVARFQIVGWY